MTSMDSKIPKFSGKSILAIDFGKKFTGVASFKVGHDPYPLAYGRIEYKNEDYLLDQLNQIISDELIDIIVLGIPYFTDGTSSKLTKEIQKFGQTLQQKFKDLSIFEQDETLSTFEAEQRMKSSPQYNFKVDLKQIDAVAATIILEDFLKSHHNK